MSTSSRGGGGWWGGGRTILAQAWLESFRRFPFSHFGGGFVYACPSLSAQSTLAAGMARLIEIERRSP